jgi:cytochrome c551/c552
MINSKYFFYVLLAVLLLNACEKDNTSPLRGNEEESDLTGNLLQLKAQCMACHHMQENIEAPSIKRIAGKYSKNDINQLVEIVVNGKRRDQLIWGEVPKNPSFLPEEDIKKVIEWMLEQ